MDKIVGKVIRFYKKTGKCIIKYNEAGKDLFKSLEKAPLSMSYEFIYK